MRLQKSEDCIAVLGIENAIAILLQELAGQAEHDLIIFDKQAGGPIFAWNDLLYKSVVQFLRVCLWRWARYTLNVLPLPGSL